TNRPDASMQTAAPCGRPLWSRISAVAALPRSMTAGGGSAAAKPGISSSTAETRNQTAKVALIVASGLANGERIAGRAGRAFEAERREHERELIGAVLGQRVEVEVLQQVYAVPRQEPLMDLERPLGVLRRHHLDRPVIGADQRDLLLAQPAPGGQA